MVSAEGLNREIAILTGPTATGKSSLALQLATQARSSGIPIEIINADSLLVYRGMNIGTAKPSRAELAQVPHHLIDIRDPNEPYNAGDFVRDVEKSITEITVRGGHPMIVGGTGFYLKALIKGLWEEAGTDLGLRAKLEKIDSPTLYQRLFELDEKAALRIGVNDRYRLVRAHELIQLTGRTPSELEEQSRSRPSDPRFKLWIIDRDNSELERRISERTQVMLKDGLIDEVRDLMKRFSGAAPLKSIGYAQASGWLMGQKPSGRQPREGLAGLEDEIRLATRQLVKRQRTWFRGQTPGQWFKLDAEREALSTAFKTLYRVGSPSV